jgi:hypothetical protein
MVMNNDETAKTVAEPQNGNRPRSADRRELLRRLASSGIALPLAVVVYNASSTIAHAS